MRKNYIQSVDIKYLFPNIYLILGMTAQGVIRLGIVNRLPETYAPRKLPRILTELIHRNVPYSCSDAIGLYALRESAKHPQRSMKEIYGSLD